MSSKSIKTAIYYETIIAVIVFITSTEYNTYTVTSSVLAGLFFGLGYLAAFSYAEYKAKCSSETEETNELSEEEPKKERIRLESMLGALIGVAIVVIMPLQGMALIAESTLSFMLSFAYFYFVYIKLLQKLNS